jgi:L-ascorbate metabolism protein UlaG (beta-lactamase superfamily)
VTIEYVAHACFRLEAGGKRVVIDPYASRVWLGYDFPAELEADLVLVTHPHYDHDAGDRIGRPSPWPEGVKTLRDPGGARMPPFAVLGFAGRHSDPYGKEFDQRNTIFVVEVAGLRIAHLGDNGPLSSKEISALGAVDVLMIPIDGDQHILKNDQVAAILRGLAPRIVVPMHYRLAALEPGEGPEDLGPIDPWLEGKESVRRLDTHRVSLSRATLPERTEIWVFEPSPAVRPMVAPAVPRARRED